MCIVKPILWCSISSSLHCHTTSKELSTVFLRLWPWISRISISWRDSAFLGPSLACPAGGAQLHTETWHSFLARLGAPFHPR